MAHQIPYYEQPTETQYYEQWVGTEGCEQYDETQGYESWGGEGQEQWDDTQSFEPVDATQGYDPCGGQGHGQWDETEGYEPWDETQAWLKEKHYESLLFFNCRHCLFFGRPQLGAWMMRPRQLGLWKRCGIVRWVFYPPCCVAIGFYFLEGWNFSVFFFWFKESQLPTLCPCRPLAQFQTDLDLLLTSASFRWSVRMTTMRFEGHLSWSAHIALEKKTFQCVPVLVLQ